MLSPIEPAILKRAHPYIVRAELRRALTLEAYKGREIEIFDRPVSLEPAYYPLQTPEEIYEAGGLAPSVADTAEPAGTWTRFRVWLAPEQPWEWCRSELLLKNIAGLRRRVGWEILGNESGISFYLVCHPDDAPLIRAAMQGQFELCRTTLCSDGGPLATAVDDEWGEFDFSEFYPDAPYFKLMTRPLELRRSPYASLIAALAVVPQPAVGLFQVVFCPVRPDHDWHRNVQYLQDSDFQVKLRHGQSMVQRYAQQMPSGDLRQMAMDLETKAHNDKPFFAAVLRLAVLGALNRSRALLRSFDVFSSLFQYGSRPLLRLDAEHFRAQLSTNSIRDMFVCALGHRRGFLLNSDELSGLVHLPPPETITTISDMTAMLDTLPYDGTLNDGTPVGHAEDAGSQSVVCIPSLIRSRHVHLIGSPGTGKTTLLEKMIIDDLQRGAGLAVLDPHGDLCERLLCQIPREAVERTIYLDPGDPEWIPLWNPFGQIAARKTGDVADGMIDVFKSFVDNWGDRLEHILRNLFIALLSRPRSTLLDIADLLRPRNQRFEVLRKRFEDVVDDPSVLEFLSLELTDYRPDELSPPRNKLSKLLLAGTVSLMFSQPESRFHLGDVMQNQMVLLVNLSQIGSQVRGITGSLLVSLFRQETMRRSELAVEQRKPFYLYCDEAHRFVTDSLEDMLAEARKYNVGLILAHQYMRQFSRSQGDALSSARSKIVFAVDENDAEFLKKDLLGMVRVEDLIAQEDFQAIARIGRTVVRIRTPQWSALAGPGHREAILERSRKLYCKPVGEVLAAIRRRRAELDESAAQGKSDRSVRSKPKPTRRGGGKPAERERPSPGENRGVEHDTF